MGNWQVTIQSFPQTGNHRINIFFKKKTSLNSQKGNYFLIVSLDYWLAQNRSLLRIISLS